MVVVVYLENINLPSTGDDIDNRWSAGSNLLVNSGIWQGWLMALELPVVLVRPQTWQAAHDLHHWQSRLKEDPGADTPLIVARRNWPDAPLEFKADGWKAVGLLLAALAFSDRFRGIDRAAMQQQAQEKRQKAKKSARVIAKARKALPGLSGDAEHGYF